MAKLTKKKQIKKAKLRTAAILTINEPNKMSDRGRKDIANWMRKQAKFFESYGKEYSTTFRARYLY